MDTLVIKFGGAAVETPAHFLQIADIIIDCKKRFEKVVVVVSAMADTTDQLIEMAKQVNPSPPSREYDMLVSVGERISISLLAMALEAKGYQAISFTGSQSGIITCEKHSNARISEIRPHRILPHLDQGKIVIVAGFQGVSRQGEITTLGRNGSDVSAVALGIALKASCVEFYKDVKGIYSEDPRKNPSAVLYAHLTHDEAIKIAESGSVLHPRCIKLAANNGLPLHVRSFTCRNREEGTIIHTPGNRLIEMPIYEEDA